MSAIARTDIYREYILKRLPTTVSLDSQVVDLNIGFASEDYNPKGEGTGNFNPAWNLVALSPEKVKKLKEKYTQVRVVISIGGAGAEYPFNPADKDRWSTAAVKSIKEIIELYANLIDGIDIHYDVIKSSPEEFSKSIGVVIETLKKDPHLTIKVVSIAPKEETQWQYRKLVLEHHSYINFVDYLFTASLKIDDVEEFYAERVAQYKPVPVLPGYLSPTILGDKSIDLVVYLVNHKIAPGYFTYPSDSGSSAVEGDASH